jgi:hypothetical protein
MAAARRRETGRRRRALRGRRESWRRRTKERWTVTSKKKKKEKEKEKESARARKPKLGDLPVRGDAPKGGRVNETVTNLSRDGGLTRPSTTADS